MTYSIITYSIAELAMKMAFYGKPDEASRLCQYPRPLVTLSLKDIASGIVLAETMAEHMSSKLVLVTIKKALNRWHLPAGTIFHSDRGSQYTFKKAMEYLSENQIRQSFSRVGKPGDNAWSESFFANLTKPRH